MLRLRRPLPADQGDVRFTTSGGVVRFVYGSAMTFAGIALLWWIAKPLVLLEGEDMVDAPQLEVGVPNLAQVETVQAIAGQEVKAGQLLATVEMADYVRDLRQLEERLQAIRLAEDNLETRLRVARGSRAAAADRLAGTQEALRRLERADPQFVSASHADAVRRQHAEAVQANAALGADIALLPATLADARAAKNRILADIAEIRRSHENAALRAPISGVVGSEVGHVGATLTPGRPLLTIYDSSQAYVRWRLPRFALVQPDVGDKVFVIYGRTRLAAHVHRILPVVDAGAEAGQLVEVRFAAGLGGLPIGSPVTVRMNYLNAHGEKLRPMPIG